MTFAKKEEVRGSHMFWKLLKETRFFVNKCREDNISAFAAQSAFFVILSVIPFLMAFISLAQYTPVTESMVMDLVVKAMPPYIAPHLISIIHEVYSRGVGTISATAVVAVWASAKGVQYLSNGLNVVYDRQETRNWLRLRLRAMLYTLGMLVAIVLSLTLLVFGNSIQGLLAEYIPFVAPLTKLALALRGLIIPATLIFFFAILFKMLPNRKAKLRSQLPGSALCAAAWYVFSFGLSVYIDTFHGFSMYGSLTAIALVMLWVYFCMYILLVCGEVNHLYEQRCSQRG